MFCSGHCVLQNCAFGFNLDYFLQASSGMHYAGSSWLIHDNIVLTLVTAENVSYCSGIP